MASTHLITITSANFTDLVEKSTGVVVLDFWAAWCPPCRAIKPTIEALARDLDNVTFGTVDVETEETLAKRFNVTAIPVLILFKDGKVVNRMVGAQSRSAIEKWLKKLA